jgi:glycosyltransferase involved in cell wall biosynthesis
MSMFSLPQWIKPHFYDGKKFFELSEEEVRGLKDRIARFKDPDPLISVVIPAWNEENNLFRTLSSLASSKTDKKVEIVVINNNSTDKTEKILDELGVIHYFEPVQGIAATRQTGLEKAKGKYHLCADSDTFYPPHWIDIMVEPMIGSQEITGVYGRYAFVPPEGGSRLGLWFYERLAGIMIQIRKKNREYMNTLGFTMGFVTEIGRETGGFRVSKMRIQDNAVDSKDYTEESEDGTMALNLKKKGKLKLILNPKAVVYTSSRRLMMGGGIIASLFNRFKVHGKGMSEYITGKS